MKKITLDDIAKSLGVSKTLVSLILNNKAAEHGISPLTVQKVLKKVKEMNYLPNQAARGLRTGKSNLIGLIVSDISNPFYSKISRGIEDIAWKNDYHLMVCSSDEDPEKEAHLIRLLREKQQAEGLIISTSQKDGKIFNDLKKSGFPFVLIDRVIPKLECNYVEVENEKSSFEAVERLITNGAKRIGMLTISPSHISTLDDRLEGYKNALKKHNRKFEKELVIEIPFENHEAGVKEALNKLLRSNQPVDALFIANNHLAVAALESIRELGLKIPYDVKIISFDDVDVFRLSYPPVTAIAQPIAEIGSRAVEILLQAINSKNSEPEYQHIVLPNKLEIRRSCGSVTGSES